MYFHFIVETFITKIIRLIRLLILDIYRYVKLYYNLIYRKSNYKMWHMYVTEDLYLTIKRIVIYISIIPTMEVFFRVSIFHVRMAFLLNKLALRRGIDAH